MNSKRTSIKSCYRTVVVIDGRLFIFQLKLDRGASLRTLWHLVSKNLVSQAIWPRKPEMNAPRLLYVQTTPFIFSETSGNGLTANSFAFKSVAAVVSDIPLHWVCLTRCTECQDILPVCWSYTTSRNDFGVCIFFLSLHSVFFLPRLELTFSKSKFAACQSGTLSRVSWAFRIPDIDSRAKCVRSIKLSLIPNPNTPRKACFKRRLKCSCRSLKAWLTSHFWWILPHFTCLVNLVPGYILDGPARKKIDLYKLLIN